MMDEIRKLFEAWAATLPKSVCANIMESLDPPKGTSYTFEAAKHFYIAGQKAMREKAISVIAFSSDRVDALRNLPIEGEK
jgi:hypothetical protein